MAEKDAAGALQNHVQIMSRLAINRFTDDAPSQLQMLRQQMRNQACVFLLVAESLSIILDQYAHPRSPGGHLLDFTSINAAEIGGLAVLLYALVQPDDWAHTSNGIQEAALDLAGVAHSRNIAAELVTYKCLEAAMEMFKKSLFCGIGCDLWQTNVKQWCEFFGLCALYVHTEGISPSSSSRQAMLRYMESLGTALLRLIKRAGDFVGQEGSENVRLAAGDFVGMLELISHLDGFDASAAQQMQVFQDLGSAYQASPHCRSLLLPEARRQLEALLRRTQDPLAAEAAAQAAAAALLQEEGKRAAAQQAAKAKKKKAKRKEGKQGVAGSAHGRDRQVWRPVMDSEEVTCPIEHEVYEDPVVAADGHTYERSAIAEWFSRHDTSPMTNEGHALHAGGHIAQDVAEGLTQLLIAAQ
ncbi:hypothetical protein WJX72_001230 [[Myrmecia] bisecta]|uniref:U-box domain-containing protein n=1 Tax=[Myrmecia] bisecta TaxID=41462 RepID=A0AAW1Q3E0_9CHLO